MEDPIQIIEEFLASHKERNYFARSETVDVLLDVYSAIKQHTGGADGSIQERPAAPDRPDTDDRELAFSGSVVETHS